MAEPIAFYYRSGASGLHRFDPRFKTLCMVMVSLSVLKAGPEGLAVFSLGLAGAIVIVRLPAYALLHESRFFLFFLLFILAARALFTPGTPIVQYRSLTVTQEGVIQGVFFCWRLILIVVCGMVYAASTRPKEITAAVERLLAPLPFVPQKRMAIMMGLLVRFIPMILGQVRETDDAQRARGVENRKNPVYRLKHFALPVLRRLVLNAEQLATAMEARCYSEERTPLALAAGWRDWLGLIAVLGLCGLLVALSVVNT